VDLDADLVQQEPEGPARPAIEHGRGLEAGQPGAQGAQRPARIGLDLRQEAEAPHPPAIPGERERIGAGDDRHAALAGAPDQGGLGERPGTAAAVAEKHAPIALACKLGFHRPAAGPEPLAESPRDGRDRAGVHHLRQGLGERAPVGERLQRAERRDLQAVVGTDLPTADHRQRMSILGSDQGLRFTRDALEAPVPRCTLAGQRLEHPLPGHLRQQQATVQAMPRRRQATEVAGRRIERRRHVGQPVQMHVCIHGPSGHPRSVPGLGDGCHWHLEAQKFHGKQVCTHCRFFS
jgi:hypothetical protein